MASLFTGIGRAGARGAINLVGSGYAKTRDYNDFKNAGNFIMELPGSDDIIMNTIELGMQSEKEGTRKAAEILDNLYKADKLSPAKLGGLVSQVMAEGKDVFDIKGNDTKYSIEENSKGKYVKADRQVITGSDTQQWAKDVKNYIDTQIRKGKDVEVIAEDGDILTITEDTSGKARFRNSIKMKDGTYRQMTDEEYATKLRAETHIDELAEVSIRGKDVVPDSKMHKFAKDGFNYRTAYFQDFDNQYYKLTISVGLNGEIKTVYNVGKIKEAQFPRGSKTKQNESAIGTSASKYSISQDNPFVNSLNQKNTSIGKRVLGMENSDDIIMNTIELGMQSEKEGTRKAAEILDNLHMAGKEISPAKLGGLVSQVMAEGKDVFDIKGNDTKYSISYTKDNKPVAVIDEDILDGVPKEEWVKVTKNKLKEFSEGIPVSGRTIYINRNSRNEYTNSEQAKYFHATQEDKFADKMRAAGNIDDVVMASTNYVNEGLKHESDRFKDFAEGETLLKVGENTYKARVKVGLNKQNKMYLHDVLDMDRVDFEIKKSEDSKYGQLQNASAIMGESPDSYSISQDNPFVNSLNQKNTSIDSELVGNTERVFNAKVLIDDSLEYGADGYYKGGVLHLSKNAKRPLDFVLSHELTHHMQRLDKGSYNGFRMIALRYTAQQRGLSIDDIIAEKQDLYKKVGLSKGEAIDEIAADFAGEHMSGEKLQDLMQRIESGELIQNTEQGRNIIQKFIDAIRDFVERIKIRYSKGKYFDKAVELESVIDAYERLAVGAYKNRDKPISGKVKYDVSKSFAEQVHETLTSKADRNHVYVGTTPSILKQLGLNDLPMLITRGHLRDINHEKVDGVSKYHGLSESTINKLPDILNNPAIVFDSFAEKNPDAVCVLSSVTDDDELPIMVVIKPDGKGQYNNVEIDSNFILSMYGRNNPQGFLNALNKNIDKVLYINKIKTQEMIKSARLQLPADLNNLRSNTIIHKTKNVVKGKFLISEENGIDSEFDSEEVADLKDTIRFLRSRSEYLQGKVVSPSTVLSNAKDIVSEYNSGISARELAVSLSKLYKEVAQAQLAEDGDMMQMFNRARDIARNVLNKSKGIQQEMSDEVRYMRNHIRTVGISLTEEKYKKVWYL